MRAEFLVNFIIDATFRDPARPIELRLYADDQGTEITGDGYTPQVVDFDAPVGGVTQNSSMVVFGEAQGAWDSATHAGLYDQNASELLDLVPLDATRDAQIGDRVEFDPGHIVVRENQ